MEIEIKDWIFIAAAAAAARGLGALAFSYRRPSALKASLWILRSGALALLLMMIGEIRLSRSGDDEPGLLYVAVDSSKSMEDDKAALGKVLDRLSEWARSKRIELRFFRFDSRPSAAETFSDILKQPFHSEKTAIGASLRAMEDSVENGSPVLVLSDGVETQEWSPPQLPFKIFTLAFGGDLGQDAALEDVRFPPVIFARGDVPFKVTLRYPQGLKESAFLILRDKETGEILWQSAAVPSGNSPEEFSFTMKAPALAGKRKLELELKPYGWEKTAANNRLAFAAEILREKLRVLYLCGKPTLDYAYLREYLRSAHGRELVSFVILRNPEDSPPYGESELSLIPFPAHDIFSSTLGEFDLFILQDFSLARFALPTVYMDYIRQFIAKGGGFIFLSGSQAARAQEFHSYQIQGTQEGFLKNIFGLTSVPSAQPNPWVEAGNGAPLKIRDPKAWSRIFSYEADPLKNNALWQEGLSPLHSFEAAQFQDAPGKTLLAELDIQGRRYPAIASAEIGKGRAVWIGFAGSWIWKSGAAAGGNLSDLYDTFWQNLSSWVTHTESQEKPMNAVLEPEGEGFKIILNLGPGDARPETISAELLPSRQPVILRRRSEGSGSYEGFSGGPLAERIAVWIGGKKTELKLNASGAEREEMRMSMDMAYLRGLADKNQGLALGTAAEWERGVPEKAALALQEASRLSARTEKRAPERPWEKFMDGPWPALLAAMLFSVEWFLRRRFGVSA